MSDANDKVRYRSNNMYGSAVYMGKRTAAHLDWTRAALARQYSGHDIVIIQGAYNTSIDASAGTHDKDACLDVYIPGLEWFDEAQRFLRAHGWAAWVRYPPSFGWHIHMISLGYGNAPVGYLVPGQVSDYYGHRTGLSGHYSDSTWHPDSISRTIFNYNGYNEEEDDMPTIKDLLEAKVGPKATVKDALQAALSTDRALSIMRENFREHLTSITEDVDRLISMSMDDATKEGVREGLARVRARLVEEIGEKDTAQPKGLSVSGEPADDDTQPA